MQFSSSLTDGVLLKRYKRFLADIKLQDGSTITAHCPNTGSMLGCSTPGSSVRLSLSADAKRKYPFTLEMVKVGDTWVGVNTARTNLLVKEAILGGQIVEFASVDKVISEVKTSEHTRLDLQIIQGKDSTFVEVKNCSLAVGGCAMFPDAVTTRGTRHLHELARLVEAGSRAAIFFLVQRMDADRFSPAAHIDPGYSKTLAEASSRGVSILVYQAEVTSRGINIVAPLPFSLCGKGSPLAGLSSLQK